MEKTITLVEALTGFNFEILTLDKKKVIVSTSPGEIISPNSIKTVKGYGMPFFKDSFSKGNLLIQFNVAFPKKNEIRKEAIESIKKILPSPTNPSPAIKKDDKFEYLEEFHEHDLNTHAEGG